MATRDRNQSAWMAYVIVMSFVCAVLLVALGFSLYSSGLQDKRTEEAVTRATASDAKFRDINQNLEFVRGMLGQRQFSEAEWETMKGTITANPEFDALQKQYNTDMTLFGPAEPIQNKNYPKLAEYLMRELRARNAQVDLGEKTATALNAKTQSTIQSETEARRKAEEKSSQLEKDLAEARADFKAKLDDLVKENSKISETLQKTIVESKKEKAKLESTIKAKTAEVATLTERNLSLVRRIEELENVDFQAPQGSIVEVADGGAIVWINLGSADKLRPGVRFGILNPDTIRIDDAKPKAHLEVTQIIGDHQARCRVLSGSLSMPVVRGDLIYSPVWQKGRTVQFALLGKLDMDGDGLDDRSVLKNLIVQSGGEISEDLTPDGKATGKMTTDTRWLVVGERFKVTTADELNPGAKDFRAKYADMEQRARSLAVSQINLDKLLAWIRSSGEDRTIPLGSSIRGSDFRDGRPVPSTTGSVSEIYKSRDRMAPYGRPATGDSIR